jgi:hypothetical protein
MAASAAASWCGWGRDTSRARIAASTVTFIPGIGCLPAQCRMVRSAGRCAAVPSIQDTSSTNIGDYVIGYAGVCPG